MPTAKQYWRKEGLRRQRSIDKSHSRRESDVQVTVYVAPVAVGVLGGGIEALRFDLKKVFENNGRSRWTKLLL